MSPEKLVKQLWAAGYRVELIEAGTKINVIGRKLTPEQREFIIQNKQPLIDYLMSARRTTAALVEVAMACCDHHGDSPAARDQMRVDCQATPAHLVNDLLEHLKHTYPKRAAT